jgi:hypothetical protein
MLLTHCVLQVIEELLSDPTDQTNLYLMYASHTTDDIMWVTLWLHQVGQHAALSWLFAWSS